MQTLLLGQLRSRLKRRPLKFIQPGEIKTFWMG